MASAHSVPLDPHFSFVDALDGCRELAPAWNRLANQAGRAPVLFQHWPWVHSWLRTFAATERCQLRILVGRQGADVILIWPWILNRRHGLRVLEPVGGLLACFDDALVATMSNNAPLLRKAWDFIQREAGVDAIELRAVHEDAAIAPLMRVVGGAPVSVTAAPAVDLTPFDDLAAYLAQRPKKMRQNQRRSYRSLARLGALRATGNDPDISIESAIDTCLEFKSQWLKARGLAGKTLVTDAARTFLHDVCQRFAAAPAAPDVCISTVHLDDRPISIGVGFRHNGVHYEYLGGFDYQLEHCGPGRLRMEYGLRDCLEQRLRSYDMLTPATRFKKLWTSQCPVVHQYVVANTWRGKMYRDLYLRKLRPRVKQIYNRLPAPIRGRLGPRR